MRIVALIDDRRLIEHILRRPGLWPACCDAPFPDHDTEPVMACAND